MRKFVRPAEAQPEGALIPSRGRMSFRQKKLIRVIYAEREEVGMMFLGFIEEEPKEAEG